MNQRLAKPDAPALPGGVADPVLEIRDLAVDYGSGSRALHAVADVSFDLGRGELLGIAGESGSGKSTLAYAITRLLRPPGQIMRGQARYRPRTGSGIDVLALSDDELRRFRWAELAIVFQSAMNALNPVLSVHAQLDDVLRAHRRQLTRAQRRARILELLRLVGIPGDRTRAYPHELSGGMRQRVVIAMALALDPEIVIMDEPTTALDVVIQRQILSEIAALRTQLGFSIVFITHDLSLLIEVADRIAVMYAGRLVELAAADALYRSPRHPYGYGLLNSFPPLHGPQHRLSGIPGAPPDLRAVPSGCAFRTRCGWAHDRCVVAVPTLQPSPLDAAQAEHQVACHLYDEGARMPSSLELDRAARGD
ncbi:MAG: ABC transporter ATP-binding protein [Jatrophihabitantaceae bacterium]